MKYFARLLAVAALLGVQWTAATTHAQIAVFDDWTAAAATPADWMNGANWNLAVVPDLAANSDIARITNGGQATLAAAAPTIGGLILGNADNQTGQLTMNSGASLTAVFDPGFPASNGNLIVGQATTGRGTLTVNRGASLTALNLSSGGNTSSLITLGGTTGSGSATVNVGNATLARTTRVIGPNVSFTATDTIGFQSTSTLIAQITGAAVAGGTSHSALKANTVGMNGTLALEFAAGITPTIGNAWNLFDVNNVAGEFAAIDASKAKDLPLGQVFATRTQAGGTNGKLVQLGIEQRLVLNVNRGTGAVAISNPGGSAIALDGFSVSSATLGALNLANFTPVGGTWQTANSSANRISQLNPSGTLNITGGGSQALGNLFQAPTPVALGDATEDLAFTYTDGGVTRTGIINYIGSQKVNNLTLLVDPATGQTQIRNTSNFPISLDGYTVASTFGALDTAQWSSLDDQNAAGGDWQEANVSANRISELKFGGSVNLTTNQSLPIGSAYNETSGKKDLTFQFLLSGETTARTGAVVYGTITAPSVPGDFDGNGLVNAADLTKWKGDYGVNANSDANGDGKSDGADFLIWQRNFGAGAATVASAAVPEPATAALLLGAIGLAAVGARRSR
ncbi:PEP-CTERM sorting domain-containing protein [Lacipirellula sp.]|uniref:PEP-CTERM sorting domain-containing protein n=1 Tax=Lacipirellula sp. TaxID=2691419 RepID=UPI003D12637E